MWSRRWTKYVTALVMIVMIVPGAFMVAGALSAQEQDEAQDEAVREGACSSIVERLVAALDGFTRQFDGVTALSVEQVPPMPSMKQLRKEAAALDQQLAQGDCGEADTTSAIEEWRDGKGAIGPLARAVRAALAANVLDVVEEGDERVRLQVRPGDDLETVLLRAPAGATVVLPEGRFDLKRTVALVQDLTIRGAGPGRTLVTSSAEGAGLLVASPATVTLTGMRIEHRGGRPASVLVLRAGAAELENVEVAGATREDAVGEGAGSLLAGGSGIVLAGGERLRMSDSLSADNAVAGLLVASGTPRVEDSAFRDNGVCGVCYVGESGGQLLDSILAGNGVGVMLGERSAPVLEGNVIEDNDRAGMLVEGDARPVVGRNTVRGNGTIGLAVYGTASPRLTDNTVSGHEEAGILVDVAAGATPRVQGNVLRDNGSAGIVFMGRSRGSAEGNSCSGSRFGLVLDGAAAPTVGTNACAVQDQRPENSPR